MSATASHSPYHSARPHIPVHVAAHRLDVSPRCIRQLLQQGRLEGFKQGPRIWRVFADTVERLKRERAQRRENYDAV